MNHHSTIVCCSFSGFCICCHYCETIHCTWQNFIWTFCSHSGNFHATKGPSPNYFFQNNPCCRVLASSPGHFQILSRSHAWSEIKSGSGLGTRLVMFMLWFDSCELLCILSLFYYESRCVKYWMFNIARIAYHTVLKTLTALIHLQKSQ